MKSERAEQISGGSITLLTGFQNWIAQSVWKISFSHNNPFVWQLIVTKFGRRTAIESFSKKRETFWFSSLLSLFCLPLCC